MYGLNNLGDYLQSGDQAHLKVFLNQVDWLEAHVVEMLKLRPVRRAHTCLSEGREPVSRALAQVLGTTKEFSIH